MKTMFSQDDDLKEYSERFLREFSWSKGRPPQGVASFDGSLCTVLDRQGIFQTEFVSCVPGFVIPPHRHPGTDTIEYLLSGEIEFYIDDHGVGARLRGAERARLFQNRGVRIGANQWHRGVVGPWGMSSLVFQRWTKSEPTFLGDCWEGQPATKTHEDRLRDV